MFFPHPEYIQQLASQGILDQVSLLLKSLWIDYDGPVNLLALERGLLRKSELFDKIASGQLSVRRTPRAKIEEMIKADRKLWPTTKRRKSLQPSNPDGEYHTPTAFQNFVTQ